MALSDVVARVVAVLRAGYPHGALGGSSRRAVPLGGCLARMRPTVRGARAPSTPSTIR